MSCKLTITYEATQHITLAMFKSHILLYLNTKEILCNSGLTEVYISTFLFNGYGQDYFFQLKSASEGLRTHNILCETGE